MNDGSLLLGKVKVLETDAYTCVTTILVQRSTESSLVFVLSRSDKNLTIPHIVLGSGVKLSRNEKEYGNWVLPHAFQLLR